MKTKLDEINERLEALQARAEAAQAETTDATETKALIEELKPQIELLTAEREAAVQAKALADTQEELKTLSTRMEELKKPAGAFTLGPDASDDAEGKALEDPYSREGSLFADVRLANKGVVAARERLTRGMEGKGLTEEGKALNEAVNGEGGYLVTPAIERQLVLAREKDNILRSLCTSISVDTNKVQFDQLGLTTTAGWVAELATKPETTAVTLASVTANIYTAAGLATVSNQLLADSNPAVDQLVTADLAKRLVALEEDAFIGGSGTGQPYGILNTAGVTASTLTSTTVSDLVDSILAAIAQVEADHGSPNGIVMHPRTWTRILLAKDLQGAYYLDPTGGPQDPRTGLRGPIKLLWGVPVHLSNRIPTNLGGTTNQSRVIVGDFSEALILDRQGITVDESEHVYFTSNQTVFRVEQRVGFTAARAPKAFVVIGGAGLAAG